MKLSNKCLRAETCAKKGNLAELHLAKGSRFEKWNGFPGHLVIVGERRNRTYSDAESPMTLRTRRARGRVESIKQFKGADFTVKETWRTDSDSLIWSVQVTLKKGKKDRSLQIKQLLPYPKPCYGLGVWTPQQQFPTTVERLGGLDLRYGELCFGTALPSLTFYWKSENLGLTVTKPFGLRTSSLSFAFKGYRSNGVELQTSNLALQQGRPAVTEFMMHPHEGCWRPRLAWLYKKYPDYFNPPNMKIREINIGGQAPVIKVLSIFSTSRCG